MFLKLEQHQKIKIKFTSGHLYNVLTTLLQNSWKCHNIVMKMTKGK
jgi:hypothetical protein